MKDVEKKEKIYTTTEVMEISGLTRAGLLRRARVFGFTKYCRYVLKRTKWGNYIKEFTYTESQVRQMGCDHLVRWRNKECNLQDDVSEVEEKASAIEELRKLHPLVTDDRCFLRNWWPDTVPKCFEDLED